VLSNKTTLTSDGELNSHIHFKVSRHNCHPYVSVPRLTLIKKASWT